MRLSEKILNKLLAENTETSRKKALEFVTAKLATPNCDRIFVIRYAFKLGMPISEIFNICKIDTWFLNQIKEARYHQYR